MYKKRAEWLAYSISVEDYKKIKNIGQEKYNTLDPDILDIAVENNDLWMKILSSVDLLILSVAEFHKFEGLFYSIDKDRIIFDKISMMQKFFFIKNIVLKAGRKGAYMIETSGRKRHIGIVGKHYIDYTSAGDAFAGGLGYAIDNGYSLERGLIFGTISSSIAMKKFGYEHMMLESDKELKNKFKEEERKFLYGETSIYCNKII